MALCWWATNKIIILINTQELNRWMCVLGPGPAVGEAFVQGSLALHADQRADHWGRTTRGGQTARPGVDDGGHGARCHQATSTGHTAQCHAAEPASAPRQLRDAHDVGQSVAEMCRQGTYDCDRTAFSPCTGCCCLVILAVASSSSSSSSSSASASSGYGVGQKKRTLHCSSWLELGQ